MNAKAFSNRDLVELLGDEPELLAFADAIAETQARPSRRLRRMTLAAGIAAAAVAAALGALWASGSSPSLTERALAAVGDEPVVHAVIQDQTGWTYVDLGTGRETPQLRTFEIWFDGTRGLEHTITRIDGRLQDDMLQTPTGGLTSGGPIYTCAWIKAHPAKAIKARVSCGPNASTEPQAPTLDAALAEFVNGYRRALESGDAAQLGEGRVEGRPVTWLRLTLGNGKTERVAIDKQTSKPIRVEQDSPDGARWSYDVISIEALDESSGNFVPPKQQVGAFPSAGSVQGATLIAPSDAPAVLPGAVSAGPAIEGIQLKEVVKESLVTGYGPFSDKEPTTSTGVEFRYGADRRDGPFVWLKEASRPEFAYGWIPGFDPRPGTVFLGGFGGYLFRNGVYVAIEASDHDLIVAAARALRPASS